MQRSIKNRIAALKAYTEKQPFGVGIVSLLNDGMWSASQHNKPIRFFETEPEAVNALTGCDPIIIIDIGKDGKIYEH